MSLISRRTLLENSAKGGLALSAAGLIAACGSSSSSSSKSSSASSSGASGSPKHGGTLHAGLTGGSSSDTTDPNLLVNNTDYARVQNIYDALVWLHADATAVLQARRGHDAQQGRHSVDDPPAPRGDLPER